MTDREAMQQALEALRLIDDAMPFPVAKHAMSQLRQAIEQADQQKHIIDCPRCGHCCPGTAEQAPICAHGVSKIKCDFCKQAEQAQQYVMENAQGDLERINLVQTGVGIGKPEHEPVGHADLGINNIYIFNEMEPRAVPEGRTPLYTAPPQRQPLTHPQIHEFDWPDGVQFDEILLFVRAIEQAHGIKGEA